MRRLLCVVVLVGVGCGTAPSTGPSATETKRTQKYQRYLYDMWAGDLRLQESATSPDDARRLAKEADSFVAESWTRYGKAPSAFKDLPAFNSEYYRGISIDGYKGP